MQEASRKAPKAPKNPVKKGGYFYIMQDKDIYGGTQYIYENDNRLIDSAKITGNVTDENMLSLLKTTKGFRTLVEAVGVSVTDDSMNEKLAFVFQMYGKTNPYESGTTIRCELISDGAEEIINMDDICWSEDDLEPGQIRFEFENRNILAQATVRLYLKEGFEAPKEILNDKIQKDSEAYRKMIESSLLQHGNLSCCKRAIEKAQNGEDVTIAFIGGSITQGAGAVPINTKSYAYLTYESFKEKYGKDSNVHFIKAGVGGTPSELGMIRFERDVLRDGKVSPDIIVIEFAVNDEGDETNGKCYESLVRKCLGLPNKPGVILLFSVFSYDWNLQERLIPIGENYNLPMVSIKDAVTPQFKLKKGEGRVIAKNQFFYDIYHPSNQGHEIMSQCLMNLFEHSKDIDLAEDVNVNLEAVKPVVGGEFEAVKLYDKKDGYEGILELSEGAFTSTDKDLQSVEMDDNLNQTPQFPYNWHKPVKGQSDQPFIMKIRSKALFLIFKDSGSPEFGSADIYVDDTYAVTVNPKDNGWTHCNTVLLYDNERTSVHSIQIKMTKGDSRKAFTILGFGYVE
jgi:hypothetical protein